MGTIRDQVAVVARLRAATAKANDQLTAKRERFNREHATEIDQVALCRRDLEAAEAALRQAVLDAYQATGATRVGPGVTIKIYTRVGYDPAQALAWAREHDLCLALDVHAFERIAKGGAIDCVTLRQEPGVTLAADLGAALELDAAFATKEER